MCSSVKDYFQTFSKEIWSAWLKFGSPRLSLESESNKDSDEKLDS